MRVGADPWLYWRGPDGILRTDADGEVRSGTAGGATDPTIDALAERWTPRPLSIEELARALRAEAASATGARSVTFADLAPDMCPTCAQAGLVQPGASGEVLRCSVCGLLSRPVDPALAVRILEHYAGADGSSYFERTTQADGTYVDGYEFYEEYIEIIRNPAVRRAQLERRMGRCPNRPRAVCDVGAAMGHDVVHLRSLGFDAVGLEPSAYSRRRALEKFGILLEPRPLVEARLPDASFDAVIYSDVFEHLLEPAAELREIPRVLRPGGVLLLELPNQASLVADVLGAAYLYGEHVLFLGPQEAERLLASAGFDVLAAYSEHDEYFLIERLLTQEQSAEVLALRKGERLTVVARTAEADR